MTTRPLGRIAPVELRSVWTTESTDFTPWLAREENLQELGNRIGIELELEARERNVGPFRADLLCKDVETNQWVLIENQLERTDHMHLGQLLAYASGLQAVTIIWIAREFTDEHRATLDWLNEITDERFRFFGVELELWQIGASDPAPRFNVVSKPNGWTRSVRESARASSNEPPTELQATYERYWTVLRDTLTNRQGPLTSRRPLPQHWTNFKIGRSGFRLTATLNARERRIGAELFIYHVDAKAFFHQLEADKAAIETEVGQPLSWEALPDRIGSRIALYRPNSDPTSEPDWRSQHQWLVDALERLHAVFGRRVQELDADDWRRESADAQEAAQ